MHERERIDDTGVIVVSTAVSLSLALCVRICIHNNICPTSTIRVHSTLKAAIILHKSRYLYVSLPR